MRSAHRAVGLSLGLGLALVSIDARAGSSYGAIAYSGSSHQFTYVQSWSSRSAASAGALWQCNQSTPNKDCVIAVDFQDACAALAIDYYGDWGGWWQSPSPAGNISGASSTARRRALQGCKEHAGAHAEQCRVVMERCAIAFNL